MEHIAALLLIIGCSQDLSECREMPTDVTVFETMEECDALLPARFSEFQGSGERTFARCVYVDPAMEEMDAELVWDVTEEAGLVASVEPIDVTDVVVASNTPGDDQGVAHQ